MQTELSTLINNAAEIVVDLIDNDVAPDHDATSADGVENVRAWAVAGTPFFVIAADLGYTTDYTATDDIDDLLEYVAPDLCLCCSAGEAAVAIANMYGIDAVHGADRDCGRCIILETHYEYGGAEKTEALRQDNEFDAIIFDSYRDAEQMVDKLDNEIYVTMHNEPGRPVYTIIEY